ncbi:CHAT domain-containing protein [Micromonospora sp. DR5-3]|uniref:CHAT domain-containing protein n=1 Tax=unclassified Micromonospora TaxID=2617518 RepID=UPI001651F57F|nr:MULTISPECIES: CHAT domain-containing protein [unclassified Micromonospora]MCW3814072.1 CHAT domain-containing protein [Micromonospora sp. DR5-3]
MRLEVLDFAGPARWRWRLTDADGRFVADHEVNLNADEWQYEAFIDLSGYLLWHAAPDRRLTSEAELVGRVGEWIGQQVLGPIGEALLRARQPVCLEVPAGAEVLAYRPWELAHVGGRALALQRVSFVVNRAGRAPWEKTPVGQRLRMLAVFSLPEDASALNLRRERYALAQLVQEIAAANGKAVELRVLQYGATRARLEDALLEEAGWDVVHISGHGLPAGLLLEDETGQRDLVSSRELVGLLDLAGEQIKLVTLSTCESAAVTAAEHLRLLGLRPPNPAGSPSASGETADAGGAEPASGGAGGAGGSAATGESSLPAVASELVDRLDCAVLAMRFAVVDDFAIALAGSFYQLVVGKGQPVARALALTMPRVVADPPTPGAPALSVATPALFGARAGELRLEPPPGAPVVFQAEQQKLAAFPPQPERFVGRVGPMTRATAVLAPRSGQAGVVFHGMAGAGKTASALELAYTHEASFARLVWHAAPPEGYDIAGALTNLALDLERQLPGVKLAHLVDDATAFRGFLPAFAEFLRRNRVLLVLDNVESLITEAGHWRDQRWEWLITALCGHGGLSRLVLTSRRRPARLPSTMLVESVHALSLSEAVLLAREWRHLRALIDAAVPGLTADQARGLAARTLAVVQGHPKLIELADGQAADPAALTRRLDEADSTWLATGTRLDTFLREGEAAATDGDYLQVLDGWTRGATGALPDDARTFFAVLCCLEPDDRIGPILDANWVDVWRRLGKPDPAPSMEAALASLVEQALVSTDRNRHTGRLTRLHLHPGVAESGRAAAAPDLATAVDAQMAAYWLDGLRLGLVNEHEEMGWLVLRAARAAAPYLLRQQDWAALLDALGTLLYRDQSPDTTAALQPLLRTAAEATDGTDLELKARSLYARALAATRPDQAEPLLQHVLTTTDTQQKHEWASAVAGDLVNLYMKSGRLDEALSLIDVMKEHTRQAGHGPWTQLGDEGQRVQILVMQGHYEEALDVIEQLRASMAALPETPERHERSTPWNVREGILDTGAQAARSLNRWQEALDLNAELLDSLRRRGATESDQARSEFNDYAPLLRLGRTSEARALLLRCRAVFEAAHDIEPLGKVLGALADLEDDLGHGDRAIDLEKDALRLAYAMGHPDAVLSSHHNLAYYMARYNGDPREEIANRLAAAMIAYQTGSLVLPEIKALARRLAHYGDAAVPESFDEVCRIVDQMDGAHLAGFIKRLPLRAPDGPAALAEVLRRARALPPEESFDLARYLAWWEPIIAGMSAAALGETTASHAVDQALTYRSGHPDWTHLVTVLRRIHAGDRDPDLSNGLDPIDTAIAQHTLDVLAGTATVDPDAWHTLTAVDNGKDGFAVLSVVTIAAASGDAGAADTLRAALDQLTTQPGGAGLATALRRILEGDRDLSVADGLNPSAASLVMEILAQLNPPESKAPPTTSTTVSGESP